MKSIRSIVLFSLAFLLVVVVFELLLSKGGILIPIVRIDPERGERYIPNKTCCSMFVCEGFGLSPTNESGWFGPNFIDKGQHNTSVGVIGNSFVAARHVFYRQNFLSIAEQELNKKRKDNYSFFNFGKEDLPLKEIFYVKQEISAKYNPDRILILLNNGSFNQVSGRYVATYQLVDNKLQLDTSFKQASFVKNFRKFEWLTQLSVVFLAHRVKNHMNRAGEIIFDKFYIPPTEDGPAETLDEIGQAINDSISDEQHKMLEELAKDKRVVFLLNLNPVMDTKVRAILGESAILDIRYLLQKMKKETGINPNYWEVPDKMGHWNIAGHAMLGKEIAKYLEAHPGGTQ